MKKITSCVIFAAFAFAIAGGAHAFNFPKVPVFPKPPLNPTEGFKDKDDAPAKPSIECGGIPKIKINTITNPIDAPQYLQEVLDNIATPGEVGLGSLLSAVDGKYHLCFEFEKKPLSNVVEPVLVMNTVELHIPGNLNSAVVIEHLILKNVDLPPADPVIRIKDASNVPVTIKDMVVTEAVNGVSIESAGTTGNVRTMNSKVECAQPDGYGINIENPNTVLDTVEVSGCGDAIVANALNAQVLNSEIHHNGIGVRMLKGAKVVDSAIYANDSGGSSKSWRFDGIRDEVVGDLGVELMDREIVFYSGPSGGKITSDNVIFTNTSGYIALPEMPSGEAVLNLYYTDPDSISCKAQACELIYSIKIKSGDFDANGLFTYNLKDENLNKYITAIYNEPNKWSTVISKPIMLAEIPQIVAFVQTPYDIPTGGVQPPVEDKKVDGDDVSGYTGGTDFDGLEDYDPNALEVGNKMNVDNVDGGAPVGCASCASLIEADYRTFLLGGSVLWMLVALGGLIAGRRCAVRIRLKTRRYRRD